MGRNAQYRIVARDLEKLPPELIEPVLADLDFDSIVRISQHGGDRVTWSIENSPTWRYLFKNNRVVLQDLMRLDDEVTLLCVKDQQFPLENAFSSKLCWRTMPYPAKDFGSYVKVCHAWLAKLRGLLEPVAKYTSTFGNGFHDLAQFLPSSDERDSLISLGNSFVTHKMVDIPRGTVVEELQKLTTFVTLYKRARRLSMAANATELRRLAALYEKHPTRLKQPYGPQSVRKNVNHVPWTMKIFASRLENPPPYYRMRYIASFRQSFPYLVPYDRCLRLFVRVIQDHPIPSNIESGAAFGIYPQEIFAHLPVVLDGLPYFYNRLNQKPLDKKTLKDLRTANTPWSHEMRNTITDSEIPEPNFLTIKTFGNSALPHVEAELKWLEAFVACVEWMEGEFPHLAAEVQMAKMTVTDEVNPMLERKTA